MKKILVFAGTGDGRTLAEILSKNQIETHVSVATEYGEEVLKPLTGITTHQGRLDGSHMEELIRREGFDSVIDATHPFAVEVSAEIKRACLEINLEYIRLVREKDSNYEENISYAASNIWDAIDWLNQGTGNILLTTGSKNIDEYVEGIKDKSRIYARILAVPEAVEQCKRLGLTGKQIICMQGPFSEELNYAMLKQIEAEYLVTKETGPAGGFLEKIKAAERYGAKVCVLKRPKEEGYALKDLLKKFNIAQESDENQRKKNITLVGIGMGFADGMTAQGIKACQKADVILGAGRMTEALYHFNKPMFSMYKSDEIAAFIKENQYENIVIALSGDVGFFSGAAKLLEAFTASEPSYNMELICGISSVVYFTSRLKIPWEDVCFVSRHGREQNPIGKLRRNEKVFVLMDGSGGVRRIAKELLEYHMPNVRMHVGNRLGYPEESIETNTPEHFVSYDREGLCVVLLVNENGKEQVITHGMPDEAFIRGRAPMTKEEVRSVSISKLSLTKHSIVYDIGAGTGSVAVECAIAAEDGSVYAIEKKEEAIELLWKNKYSHQAENLHIVSGKAPEALNDLPAPTHAFIGGTSGSLKQIIEILLDKNKKIQIVINAITMETVAQIVEILKEKKFAHTDVVQMFVGKGKEIAGYHMMMGQNPVFIVTLKGWKS